MVRVACPSTYSEISLEGKFGAPWSEAPALIRRARQTAESLGVSFHGGSQMMCTAGYGQVLRTISQQIVRAATLVEISGDYTGTSGEAQSGFMMLALICELADTSVFVKMVGPESTVRAEAESFQAFCQSLRFAGDAES